MSTVTPPTTTPTILDIINNNIVDIATKSTLGYNGYYTHITWEIDKDGNLREHWLGSQEVVREEKGSVYFHTDIDRDTDYLLGEAIMWIVDEEDEFDFFGEGQMHIHDMDIYKPKLIDQNIIDQDGKVIDVNSLKKFMFDEFWLQDSCDHYLAQIKEQLKEQIREKGVIAFFNSKEI